MATSGAKASHGPVSREEERATGGEGMVEAYGRGDE